MWRIGGVWLVGAAVVVMACTRDTRIDLAQAARLEGKWELEVHGASGPRGGEVAATRGELALIVNTAGTRVPNLDGIPLNVGVHDLRLAQISPALRPHGGVPGVAGGLSGDSVVLVAAPTSAFPLRLRGVLVGDSVIGVWSVSGERVVMAATGRFVMRRR